jgi:hypothetical protein
MITKLEYLRLIIFLNPLNANIYIILILNEMQKLLTQHAAST